MDLLRGELATGPGLSGRDRQVLELIGDGLTDRQIAQRLNEPVEEAKGEVLSLLGKLGLRAGLGRGRAKGWPLRGSRCTASPGRRRVTRGRTSGCSCSMTTKWSGLG